MGEAPERIYLDGDVEAGDGIFPRCFENPKYVSEPPVEYVRADRIEELEAKLAKAVEALEWQADAIHNSITVNMKHNHRILLDGIYHEGPLVDWVHKILTGFEAINRTTIAELKGETDE